MALACPNCGQPLEVAPGESLCDGCGARYPRLGGLPWVVPDAAERVAHWAQAAQQLRADFDRRIHELGREAGHASLPAATRDRLTSHRKALIEQKHSLAALLAPLPQVSGLAGPPTAANAGLFSYAANIHRDWADWGRAENEATFALVKDALLPSVRVAAVLGSGPSRLAFDVARALPTAQVFATDCNPLPLWIADRVTRGETLDLFEFPIAPRSPAELLAKNSLRAPAPRPAGLHFAVADVWDPPFAEKSLDLVLTPWLIDILPEPPERILARVNALLKDDGCWLCLGSLAFDPARPGRQLLDDEFLALVEASGFRVLRHSRTELPYLRSPHSAQSRTESVFYLEAEKKNHRPLARRESRRASWIEDTSLPIPATPALQAELIENEINAFVLSLVDGQQSLRDLARTTSEHFGMPESDATALLRNFFARRS